MNKISRRSFMATMATAIGGGLALRFGWAKDLPSDLKVTRIVGFDVESVRSKIAGKNASKDVHGARGRDSMVRIYTNTGHEGLGYCRLSGKALSQLLGKDPMLFYKASLPGIVSPLGSQTMVLWDLAGKILGKPVYELLGSKGPKHVPVYDGSIYFMDLLPQYDSNWKNRLKEEIDMGLKLGHRAFKVKIGRGHKWMPAEEGYARDIEVLKLIRMHTGQNVTIGVDSNNGYDLDRAKRLLSDLPDYNIAFVEEQFPEDVNKYRDLKNFIRKKGLKTLIADGENWRKASQCKPFVEAEVIDILQADMRRLGFEGIMEEAAIGRPSGCMVAPHNWGSLIGYYMELHTGRAIDNFYMAEHDPLSTNLIIADGYSIKNGKAIVPDSPGMGLKVSEKEFEKVILKFDLKG